MPAIRLIVGLGNPGAQYQDTRHNAGAWFIERIAEHYRARLSNEAKFFAETARVDISGHDVRLAFPTGFMNRSGQSVAALASFYKLAPEEILIAHDELDLNPGVIRLKTGGGHGGHNGLRDIIPALGNQNGFHRLRIGIGHPGNAAQVTGWVLGKAPASEQNKMDEAIAVVLTQLDDIVAGNIPKVMNRLNTKNAD